MNERYGEQESKKVAERLLSIIKPHVDRATVVGLSGDLGAGKTTLTKAIAEILGVHDTVQSPTFVIAKFYPTTHDMFNSMVHIDAYRIESIDELAPLGWEEVLTRPRTIVIVEWPERIEGALPNDAYHFSLSHDGDNRTITHTNG